MLTGSSTSTDEAVYAGPANGLSGIERIDHASREKPILCASFAFEWRSITYTLVDVFEVIRGSLGRWYFLCKVYLMELFEFIEVVIKGSLPFGAKTDCAMRAILSTGLDL